MFVDVFECLPELAVATNYTNAMNELSDNDSASQKIGLATDEHGLAQINTEYSAETELV